MGADYVLLDVGGGARLERFAARVTDRPHPGTLGARREPEAWRATDLRFDRDRGWTGEPAALEPWAIAIDDLMLELKATDAGQVGLFPEHAAMLPWLRGRVAARTGAGGAAAAGPRRTPAVLHLFAYTGLATLAMVASGARVTHVDASRPTMGWARHMCAHGRVSRKIPVVADARWVRGDPARSRSGAGFAHAAVRQAAPASLEARPFSLSARLAGTVTPRRSSW